MRPATSTPQPALSVDEYLRLEAESPRKHEYVDGVLYAMAGTSRRHNRIAGNIYRALRDVPGNDDCEVSFADVRLRPFERLYYYPDVVVTCDPSDDDQLFIARPCLVVEVLSESTATIDRREKLFTYRQIETLQAYLVVHQDEPRIERHWRDASGEWWSIDVVGDSIIPIPYPESQLPLTVVYDGVLEIGMAYEGG